jgi:DNA-binding Lrp family transcriptional regulator
MVRFNGHFMISEQEKKIAQIIQGDLPLVSRPFKGFEDLTGLTETDILQLIHSLRNRGIIRKFGAILRHQKIGYTENAMVVWAVPSRHCEKTGNLLASFPDITHCYERTPPFEGKYTLFTMVHFRSGEEKTVIQKLSAASGIKDFKVLTSVEEYKKSSMEYF